MRYTISREHRAPAPRKLAWALAGLACVLLGSAALAWQNGGTRLRSAVVEEAEPTNEPAAPARRPLFSSAANSEFAQTSRTANRAPQRVARPAQPQPTQADEKSSFLPFRLPAFLGGGSASREEAAPARSSATSRSSTGAAKALGRNSNPRTAPQSKANAGPSPAQQAEQPFDLEMPTLPLPKLPARDKETQPEPTLAKPAPAFRSVPVEEAAPAKPAPAVAAKPSAKVMVAPEVTHPAATPKKVVQRELPVNNDVPRTLTPLQVPAIADARPAGFQQVTPGETKLADIAQHLGEPLSSEREGNTTVLTYEVGPFPKLEVIVAGEVVDSVVIHLKEPVAENDILTELALVDFQAVDVRDEAGQVLGRAIPERGVALSYHGDAQERQVGEVVLATVTAESFLLRALGDTEHRYEQMLADANFAVALDPGAGEAYAVQARILFALGRISEARTAIEAAIKLDSGAADYRLVYARVLGLQGDYANAIKMTETVANTASIPREFAAQAELVWGDLLAHGPERDFPGAVAHHTKAIKLATELSQDADPVVRRAALQTLVDANLAVARDVALGNYKRKSEVVPKWIDKAEAVKQLALQDGASEFLHLHVAAHTVAAYSCLPEPPSPTEAVELALAKGQELIADSTDSLYKQQLEWTLGVTLLDAVQIEHARGEFEVATQYANNALALLKDNAGHREPTPHRDYVLGRMFFAMGALYAVGQGDHAEAVHYYLQAIPLLEQPLPDDLADEQGRHGERFVSMGVSFWQNGNKAQAVELTLSGAELLRQAVDAGHIEKTSLAVPYGNLAAMYKSLGNSSEAKKFGDLAQKLEEPRTSNR